MWNIRLVDIGGDGLITEKVTPVDTLPECEVMAGLLCARHLGVQRVTLLHTEDLIYGVLVNGLEVGVVVITIL